MKITKDREMEVMGVHNLFWESYAHRDIELRFSLCSEDVTFIGSGLHERALNKTEYKSINKEGVKQFPNPFQIDFLWTNLSMLNEFVACVESEVVWSQLINNELSKELLRNTTLLKYENNRWLITHVHGSVPDYRLKVGDYMTNEQTIIRNRELERQVFERTRDLNKTLGELEQKNRELEIETALEKVRTIAMGMREREDMLDVCRIISDQLQSLGVNDIRNVQTALFYETKKTYINFEYYPKHNKSLITEVDYRTHELQELFANKMIKGVEELFSETLRSKEVKDWYAYQKTTNQFADTFLETAESLSYYWYSLGPVALGMSTYIPLNEQEINLFKRFRNVFELAYRRFMDIQQAQAQAREAKIEAALEKVRAVAMSMMKSDELLKVCESVFNELRLLGFTETELRNTQIVINNDEREIYKGYQYSDYTGGEIAEVPYDMHPVIRMLNDKLRQSKDAFADIEISGTAMEDWKNFVKSFPQKPDKKLNAATELHYYFYSVGIGALGLSSFKSLPEEKLKILQRLRNVFNLSYQRYTDIALAEAQAREAQIELALERVRARTMAMQHSEELAETAYLLFQQFKELDKAPKMITIGIMKEEESVIEFWVTDWSGGGAKVNRKFNASIDEPVLLNKIFTAWKEKKKSITIELAGKELQDWINYRVKLSGIQDDKDYSNARGLVIAAFFSKGILSLSTYESHTPETVQLLERFSGVFDGTYTRFLDLQKAEAQAREAKIEASLERVRSRTMGMQKSDELAETVSVLFKQLLDLGVKSTQLRTCGIVTFKENEPKGEVWITDITGEIIDKAFSAPYDEAPAYKMIYSKWKKGEKFLEINLKGDDFLEHLTYVKKYSAVPNINLDEIQKSYSEIFFHVLFFSAGYLFIISYEPLPEYHDIFKRFGTLFQQTYTRFLDFKNAEARAREAMMQASLDRLRAEIASMRNAEDLQRITPLIWHELLTLEVPFIRCGVFIVDDEREKVQVYLSTPDGKSLGVLNFSFDENELTINTVDHWRKKLIYTEHWSKEQFINWSKSMIELGQIQNTETYQGSSIPPESLDLHFIPFVQGMLYVGNTTPLTDEKIHLVKSLADSFSIAYTRYEDFKNLEEAKNRVEATLGELKSAQTQLVQAEKLASLGQLTAGIAHEIKNPLNFVNNFSEISNELIDEMKIELQNNNKLEAMAIADDIKQNLEKINQHGKRADSIVKGMLLHSRGSVGEKSLTNINDLLDQYVNLAYHGLRAQDKEFNITIQRDFDETLEKINVVPQDISRVFLNIVNNGFYAANEKKKKLGDAFAPALKVSTKDFKDKVEIRIRDNGNGIPQSIKKNIFNPFFTTKPTGEGTGLGLSLSYDIITKVHNGEIIFETKENEFTEFTITIPRS